MVSEKPLTFVERAKLLMEALNRAPGIEEEEDLCVTAFRAVDAEARAELHRIIRGTCEACTTHNHQEPHTHEECGVEIRSAYRQAEQRGRAEPYDFGQPVPTQPETLTPDLKELREIAEEKIPALIRWFDRGKSTDALSLVKILRAFPALVDAAEERDRLTAERQRAKKGWYHDVEKLRERAEIAERERDTLRAQLDESQELRRGINDALEVAERDARVLREGIRGFYAGLHREPTEQTLQFADVLETFFPWLAREQEERS